MILFIVIKMGPDLLQSPQTQILPSREMCNEGVHCIREGVLKTA